MSQPAPQPIDQIDELCDELEREWKAGKRPSLEAYLERVSAENRGELLRELLALEVEYRLKQGERPLIAEYRARFPQHNPAILAVFTKPVPILPTAAAPPPDGDNSASLILTAVEGPHTGQTYTFHGHDIFLVGRSKQAHLQVTDAYFSRVHFMVEMNPPDCRLTDMGSRNGTYVNDRKVTASDLRDGDKIKAGSTVLLVTILCRPDDGPATSPLDSPTRVMKAPVLEAAAPTDAEAPSATAREAIPSTCFSTVYPPESPTAPLAEPVSSSDTVTFLPEVPGYKLLKELGRGGMGIVYLAECSADGNRVAMKTVKPAVSGNRKQLERFLREAAILRELEHPHIVAFREVGETKNLIYFAMEFVDGTDASKIVKSQGPMSPRSAVRMICQLLPALKYAHDKGYVHRDIKPANLLVTTGDGKRSVKLADFGLARVYQASPLSGLTMQGEVGGTPAYMPPEQITQFREVKPAADQYSIAATLYNLLTGQMPFEFDSGTTAALIKILQDEPIPLRKRRPELPEGLATAIHRAMAKNPADRFATVMELRSALLPFTQ